MITIIRQLHNFEIAGFGNMTIICTTKKNGIFLYQFISSMNEYWILAHSSCFGTPQISTNCRAGVGRSSRIPLHQRGRRVAVYWSLSAFIEKPLLQDSNTTWTSTFFVETTLLTLSGPSKWEMSQEEDQNSPVLSMKPMNPAYSSWVWAFIHMEIRGGISL